MALKIGDDDDVETTIFAEGNWDPHSLPAWKGRLSLVSLFKSWLMWEFPVVIEHEDGWSNKEGFWKLPNLAFLTFLIFLRTYPSLCYLLSK